MITDGFFYLATIIFIAAILINLPRIFTGAAAKKVFKLAPPIVLIYLGLMVLCSAKLWDLEATAATYGAVKNPILYAMLFLMLLRCDLRQIIRLGPKMLLGFFVANISVGLGFILAFLVMKNIIGLDAWMPLGALCGSWMGGGGNMLAVQSALNVKEGAMAYALVMDSICGMLYVMFLLWAINFSEVFNRYTKADTKTIDEVGTALAEQTARNEKKITFQNVILLVGAAFLVSSVASIFGSYIATIQGFTVFDKGTWTVLVVTLAGVLLAVTPFGKTAGTEELSNTFLYIVIALIASRADIGDMGDAPWWLLTGVIVLFVHVIIMIILAKLFHLDIFTCAVASLANIGGTATAPVLAGSYSSALVPVGIVMALLGYIVGTGGGLVVARIMQFLA